MTKHEFTFAGYISFDNTDNFSTILLCDEWKGNKINKSIDLVKKLRAIFDLFDSEVSVSYFISDKKKTEAEIKEGWLKQLHGAITAEYKTNSYNYSEHTYGTDYDTYLQIGGHDLFNELDRFEGKYCVLKIQVKS